MNLKEIKIADNRWLKITNPGQEEIGYLKEKFKFHPLDLKDCLSPAQRPKFDRHPEYLFMILLFPVYNRETREIESSEIDFFIGPDYLITVDDGRLPPLVDFFNLCQTSDEARQQFCSSSIEKLFQEVSSRLLLYCYPMMDHLSLNIHSIEKQIFSGHEKKMVSEIMITRRNITDFRRIMQAHKNVLKKFIAEKAASIGQKNLTTFYDSLIENTKEIWDNLESFKESIETLQETNESLISFRLNDIMKFLTIISVIMLPVGVIGGIFGMNASFMPLVGKPGDFWIILSLMLSVVFGMTFFFIKKKWL